MVGFGFDGCLYGCGCGGGRGHETGREGRWERSWRGDRRKEERAERRKGQKERGESGVRGVFFPHPLDFWRTVYGDGRARITVSVC